MIEIRAGLRAGLFVFSITAPQHDLYVSPGVRWAYNLRNGLQIVPGVGVPVGIGPNASRMGVIGYLSFEHAAGMAHSRK